MEKPFIFLAVNADGSEVITNNPDGLTRFDRNKLADHRKVCSYNDIVNPVPHWIDYHPEDDVPKTGLYPRAFLVPKGTIFKLTGKHLTYDDEPIKLDHID